MENNARISHYLEAALINALPAALRPLPYHWRVSFGGALISGAIRLLPPLRRRIANNINLIYPDIPKREKNKLIRKITRHIGRGFIQLFYNKDYYRLLKNVKIAPDALNEVKAAHAAGKPVIIVSGHFGQWEAIRVMLMRAGMTSAAIYKSASNPIFEKHFANVMSIGGAGLFPVGFRGMRPMLQHLKSGGIVSVLLDQRVDGGEVLDFLGHPALSSTAMSALALKTGAIMVPAYGLGLADGSVEILVEPSVPHGDPKEMIQQLNNSLSAQVHAHPEQWYWLHKRWARPDI